MNDETHGGRVRDEMAEQRLPKNVRRKIWHTDKDTHNRTNRLAARGWPWSRPATPERTELTVGGREVIKCYRVR